MITALGKENKSMEKPSFKRGKYGEAIFICSDGRIATFTTIESRQRKAEAKPTLPTYYGEFKE